MSPDRNRDPLTAPLPELIRFDRFEIRLRTRELTHGGVPVALGSRAFDILVVLLERNHRVVEKRELLELVWPGMVVEEANVHVQVSNLRKLLGAGTIATLPSRGYRFMAKIERPDSAGDVVTRASALSNLPPALTTLFGREFEQAAVQKLLASSRLVTIAGPAGIGKSVMALAVARDVLGSFDDGVWLVELAPTSKSVSIAATVASALQFQSIASENVESLLRAIGSQRLLLILDNCEHVIEETAAFAQALTAFAPNVRLLATSQEPLKIQHEQVFRLGALRLPTDSGLDAAREAPAVALFEARARSAAADFTVGGANFEDVVDICRQLDGIALAIELAASQVSFLGVVGLRERIRQRFRLSMRGGRHSPKRHQTLSAALHWSYSLLSEGEQAVFRYLGVFPGSFEAGCAHMVAGRRLQDESDALTYLGGLVDKSLLVAELGTEPRYRLLNSHRASTLELLRESGEIETTRKRHAEALLARFEESLKTRYSQSSQLRATRYRPDLDSVRIALDWAESTGSVQLEARLCAASAWIWMYVDRTEGLRRIQSGLAAIRPSTDPNVEARLLLERAGLLEPELPLERQALAGRAARIFAGANNSQERFVALTVQVGAQCDAGLFQEAQASLQMAEGIFEPGWSDFLLARLLAAKSWMLGRSGRHGEALLVLEEMLAIAKEQNDESLMISVLVQIEQKLAVLGRLDESIERGRALLSLMSENRTVSGSYEHLILLNLATSLARRDIVDEALDLAERSFALALKAGLTADLLDLLGFLALKNGRLESAARILGCADKRLEADGNRRHAVEQNLRDTTRVTLLQNLGDARLSRLTAEGELMTDEECAKLVFGGNSKSVSELLAVL